MRGDEDFGRTAVGRAVDHRRRVTASHIGAVGFPLVLPGAFIDGEDVAVGVLARRSGSAGRRRAREKCRRHSCC